MSISFLCRRQFVSKSRLKTVLKWHRGIVEEFWNFLRTKKVFREYQLSKLLMAMMKSLGRLVCVLK